MLSCSRSFDGSRLDRLSHSTTATHLLNNNGERPMDGFLKTATKEGDADLTDDDNLRTRPTTGLVARSTVNDDERRNDR